MVSLLGVGSALQGLGALSSIFGGRRQNRAAQRAADLNFQEQQRVNNENIRLANEMLQMEKEGITTPEGRTRFVPGQGFVTELNPIAQAIFVANQQDELRRNTVEADIAHRERTREAQRRGDEGTIANQLLEQFSRRRPQFSEDDIGAALRLDAREEVNQQFDRVSEAAAAQMMRTGQPMDGAGLGALAQQRAEALRTAGGGGQRMRSMQLADEMTNAAQGNLLNQYDMFASRAAGIRDPNFAQTGAGQALTGAAMQGAGRSPQAFGMAMTANRPSQFENPRTIDSLSLGLGSLGAGLYGEGLRRDNEAFLRELMSTSSRQTGTPANRTMR